MKILKIKDGKGYFYNPSSNNYKPIDKIDKDLFMEFLNYFLENEVEIDKFDEELIKNQAQQIIYKSIFEKFQNLNENKDKFKDESDKLYLDSFQKYKD